MGVQPYLPVTVLDDDALNINSLGKSIEFSPKLLILTIYLYEIIGASGLLGIF